MMFDGQLEWNHSAGVAPGRSKEVGVIRIAMSSNALSGVRFQI
jgi:hypothetical protein